MTALAAAADSSILLFGYGAAMIAAFIVSLVIGRRLRSVGRRRNADDPAMLAWLAGGEPRHADMLLTGLLARGAIAVHGRSRLQTIDRSKAATAAERHIVNLPSPFTFTAASRICTEHAQPMLRHMVDLGLLAESQALHRKRIAQVAPLVVLLGAGALPWLAAYSAGRFPFVLTFLLALTAMMILIRWNWLERRTQAGIDALYAAQDKHERLMRGAPIDELVLAVALFGTGILAGSALDEYHKLRASSDSAGGGDSDSSDGDSGGGCGGGCGGGD